MLRHRGLLPFFAIASLLLPAYPAAAQFADLLKRVPDDANAILLVDVGAIHRSPLGVKENWTARHKQDYLAGIGSIPPSVKQFVVAAQVNTTTMHDTWKISLAKLNQEVTLAQLTSDHPGSVDNVAGQDVVLGPRSRSYYIPFAPTITGVLHPANRQQLARWVGFVRQNQNIAISPYLMEAASTIGDAGQVVMAMDLSYVLDPAGINMRLRNSRCLAGQQADFDALTKIITGLKGVKVIIRVDDSINGQFRADFSSPVDLLQPIAKPLILEAMDRMGMHVDDVQDWAARADGMSIVLEGKLTIPGARQLLSPLLTPGAKIQSAVMESSPGQQLSQDPKATAALRYYKSLKTLLDELQQSKVKTFRHMAYMLNKYAEAIDELPMLNVDESLLKFGAWVSGNLRAMGSTALGTQAQNQFLEANMTEGVQGYGGYGTGYLPGYAISSNYTALGNIEGAGVANERANRGEVWNAINGAMTTVRRQLTEKYQVEF
jgi:hypothetical protein